MTATCRRCRKPIQWVLSANGQEWWPRANDGTDGCPAYRHPFRNRADDGWIWEWHDADGRPENPS